MLQKTKTNKVLPPGSVARGLGQAYINAAIPKPTIPVAREPEKSSFVQMVTVEPKPEKNSSSAEKRKNETSTAKPKVQTTVKRSSEPKKNEGKITVQPGSASRGFAQSVIDSAIPKPTAPIASEKKKPEGFSWLDFAAKQEKTPSYSEKVKNAKKDEENDEFLDGFNDPYGEKRGRQEKFASIRANADRRKWDEDEFLTGFNDPYGENKEKKKEKFASLRANADKRTWSDDEFLEGLNNPYGEKKEKSSWQKFLDGASVALTAASFIPGLDTITDIAQIPVDLLRGDFVGAGLDLVGAIPLVGEVADIAKTARTADKIVDGVRAADKLSDGVKVVDSAVDGMKTAEKVIDIAEATDDVYDVAKGSGFAVNTTRSGKNVGEFAKPYPKENIPDEVNECLSKLLNDGDRIQVSRAPDLEEIGLMSRQEAVEFASITVENKNYILRGNATGTTISQDMLDDLVRNNGILNCHSHPYIGDLQPSQSDLHLAEMLKHQNEFRIVTPDGMQAIYTKNGLKSVGNIENKMSESDILELHKLFGG